MTSPLLRSFRAAPTLGLLIILAGGCADESDDSQGTQPSGTTHAGHTSGGATDPTGEASSSTAPTGGTTQASDPSGGSTGESSGEASSGGYVAPTPAEYCECMLEACHDLYHSTWGEEHVESEQMCTASAEASPSAGGPAMSGDSIECRMHFCTVAMNVGDTSVCGDALGGGACQ